MHIEWVKWKTYIIFLSYLQRNIIKRRILKRIGKTVQIWHVDHIVLIASICKPSLLNLRCRNFGQLATSAAQDVIPGNRFYSRSGGKGVGGGGVAQLPALGTAVRPQIAIRGVGREGWGLCTLHSCFPEEGVWLYKGHPLTMGSPTFWSSHIRNFKLSPEQRDCQQHFKRNGWN
jgi:hypothetical protein